jgi:hypothetical protein
MTSEEILKVETLICYRDDSGRILEEHGVIPFRSFVPANTPFEQIFFNGSKTFKVRVEFIEIEQEK